MAIFYQESTRTFYLESKGLSYVFGINALGIPEHIYFGKPVGRDLPMGNYGNACKSHGISHIAPNGTAFSILPIPKEIHTPYSGDYNEPSLILEFANGSRRSDLVYLEHEILSDKPMPEQFCAAAAQAGLKML